MDERKRPSTDSTEYYLKRYKKNKEMISWLRKRLVSLSSRIEGLKSPGISDMPRGGERKSKEDLIAEKVDIERRIGRLEAKGKQLRTETLDLIDNLDNFHEAEVLERYLIDCEDFDVIADDMKFSERHVVRLYTSAVGKITAMRQESVG